jgi:hypothetical protein
MVTTTGKVDTVKLMFGLTKVAPVESITCTLKENSPGAVGVPWRSPLGSNVSPTGGLVVASHVNGGVPAVTGNVLPNV